MPTINTIEPKESDTRSPAVPSLLPTAQTIRRSLDFFLASDYWRVLKWSLMISILVWLLIYRLSEASEKLPDFVYVNF